MTTNRQREREDIEIIEEDYRHEEKPYLGIEHRHDAFLNFYSLIAAVTVALAMLTLSVGTGPSEMLKVLIAGVLTWFVSFYVNKALFHTGSKLAATGNPFVLALAACWFVLMGSVYGTISFTGQAHNYVEGQTLRQPIAALEAIVREAQEAVVAAKGVGPAVAAVETGAKGLSECEARSGCVSGRAGRGRLVGALEEIASKGAAVRRQYIAAERKADAIVKDLQKVAADYERQLSDGGVTGANRAELLAIYGRGQALVTKLKGVMPTQAALGLANELRRVQVGSGRRARIDVAARMRAQADQIEQAVQAIRTGQTDLPPFPNPGGITSGWERIEDTWPYAVLIFALEGVLIVLWGLLVLDLRARLTAQRLNRRDSDDDDDLPTAPAPVTGPSGPTPALPAGRRRNPQIVGHSNGAGQ